MTTRKMTPGDIELTNRAIAVLSNRPLADRKQMLARLEDQERLMKREQEELAREIQAYADRKSKKLKQK